MTEDDLIGEVLKREGGWRGQVIRPNKTVDPPTNKGITLPTLQAWAKRHGQPQPMIKELRFLSDETAAAIYSELFITGPGFTPANIPFEPLRVQLIDFGINSSPERAIRWLQRVIDVHPVTGVLNQQTIDKVPTLPMRLVNDALVAARCYMIDQAVDQGIIRKEDEEGLESRALSFFLAKP